MRTCDKFNYAVHDESIKAISQGTKYAAGYDMYAAENTWVWPFKVSKVKLNISLELCHGTFGMITSRSGLTTKGIVCVPGIIDSDYRGQVSALMYRIGLLPKRIKKGERVAQMLLLEHGLSSYSEISLKELSSTERGANGFGSTGIE